MNTFNDYFMSVPFEVDQINQAYKSDMIKKFVCDKFKINSDENGYNTLFDDSVYTSTIKNKFLKVIEDEFLVSSQLGEIKTWIYVQNKKHFKSVWHTHVKTSTVNAVYYIDPPKKGGGLNLRFSGREIVIHPDINQLYLFPYWMEHRPLPQDEDDWRISVNIEYLCSQRAEVKKTGILW